mmetsp:Transcript_7740/g.27512  ORF Transcript_7740/g.27512 Transcript_7740/m.27512 type:complete len:287 (-) Transcript_7740:325-1185(-)
MKRMHPYTYVRSPSMPDSVSVVSVAGSTVVDAVTSVPLSDAPPSVELSRSSPPVGSRPLPSTRRIVLASRARCVRRRPARDRRSTVYTSSQVTDRIMPMRMSARVSPAATALPPPPWPVATPLPNRRIQRFMLYRAMRSSRCATSTSPPNAGMPDMASRPYVPPPFAPSPPAPASCLAFFAVRRRRVAASLAVDTISEKSTSSSTYVGATDAPSARSGGSTTSRTTSSAASTAGARYASTRAFHRVKPVLASSLEATPDEPALLSATMLAAARPTRSHVSRSTGLR